MNVCMYTHTLHRSNMDYHLMIINILTALLAPAAFLVLVLVVSHRRGGGKNKKLNLPPGPPGDPVVGNLFQVARSGKQFFEYVRELVPVYGPILTLRMGVRTMIIVSGAELAHEALVEKGATFASRPRENPTRSIFSCNKFTVNAAVHGPVWRSLRRNMVQNMVGAGREELRAVRGAAMDTLVQRLRAEADANCGAVWVLRNARFAVFCILLAMCFGEEALDDDTIERVDETMRQVLAALKPRLDDYFPLLGIFFPRQRRRVHEVRRKQVQTLGPLIEKRRTTSHGRRNGSSSYLDTLFHLRIQGREDSPPTVPELVTLCSEFLNGGTDTTATAIEWAAARMIENPDIQSRLHDEIRSTVGDRRVDDRDVESMPYLKAVVKELLRKHPPTYFLLTHAVTEPGVRLAGYDIPPGANVEFFSQAISDDPKVWSDPQRFDPDRFFEGCEDADVTGTTGVKMMPFGAGRRICPGLAMGTVHISLMLARMVQEFEWSAHPDHNNGKLDFSETLIFTVVMKNSLRAKIKPRQP